MDNEQTIALLKLIKQQGEYLFNLLNKQKN